MCYSSEPIEYEEYEDITTPNSVGVTDFQTTPKLPSLFHQINNTLNVTDFTNSTSNANNHEKGPFSTMELNIQVLVILSLLCLLLQVLSVAPKDIFISLQTLISGMRRVSSMPQQASSTLPVTQRDTNQAQVGVRQPSTLVGRAESGQLSTSLESSLPPPYVGTDEL